MNPACQWEGGVLPLLLAIYQNTGPTIDLKITFDSLGHALSEHMGKFYLKASDLHIKVCNTFSVGISISVLGLEGKT